MMNIIRADIYRLHKGNGLIITFAVLIFVIAMLSLTGGQVGGGISYETIDTMDEAMGTVANGDLADLGQVAMDELEAAFLAPTGVESAYKATASSNNILYFLLPLISLVTIVDFSSGAVKNALSSGVSRTKYFFAKLTLSFIFCAVFLLVYALLSVLLSTLVSGFGGTFDGVFISWFVKILLSQLWLCLATVCAANFFAFLMRSPGFVGVFIAFLLVPSLLVYGLTFINRWFENLFYFDLTMTIGLMARIDLLTAGEITKILVVGAVYIVASVIGGLVVFRKAEIK